jgi:hypothetical protein
MSGKIVHRSMVAQFEAGLERKLAGGVLQALIIGAREASVLTPIDTSTLLNSQFRNVGKRNGRIVGTVGYTAEYAQAQHRRRCPCAPTPARARSCGLRAGPRSRHARRRHPMRPCVC